MTSGQIMMRDQWIDERARPGRARIRGPAAACRPVATKPNLEQAKALFA